MATLSPKMAGGQLFTELDLSHAYEQMLVDENSREFLTINTFQRTMEGLQQGIPSTGVLLDNILISGPTRKST